MKEESGNGPDDNWPLVSAERRGPFQASQNNFEDLRVAALGSLDFGL
jgi:hypothetical protein